MASTGWSKDLLYPRIPVEDGTARGADRKPLSRGQVVRTQPRYSMSLQAEVPGDCGQIVDIFQRSEIGPVFVDVRRDRDTGGAGLATFAASAVRHSSAKIRGVTREDWYGKE